MKQLDKIKQLDKMKQSNKEKQSVGIKQSSRMDYITVTKRANQIEWLNGTKRSNRKEWLNGKKRPNRIAAAVVAVVLVCTAVFGSVGLASAGEGGAGSTVYKSEQDWGNGVKYTNTVSWNSTYGAEESFSITSAIGSIVKPIVLACDTIFGSMKMDSILSYAKQLGYNVLAAINSDFFSFSTGVPLGIVVEDGVYKSSPEGYTSVVFDDTGKAGVVDYTAVQIKMTNLGQSGDENEASAGTSKEAAGASAAAEIMDESAEIAGTDASAEIAGTDESAEIAGTDEGAEIAGTDESAEISDTDAASGAAADVNDVDSGEAASTKIAGETGDAASMAAADVNAADSGEAASTKTAGETGDAASGAAADVNAAASIAAESGGDNDAVSDTSGDGVSNSNYGKSLTLTHFNKMRQDGGGMYLLDSSFSTVSTRTSTPGWSVKFKILSGTMKTKGTVMLQVVDVYTGSNAVKIDDGYMILTAADASNLYYQFQKFSVGDVVSLETSCYGNELLENAQWATGAGNIIVKDGAITDQSSWDSALKSVNPRSAVGIKADGTVIYYEIDGRQSGYSKGLTMKQLAQEFIDLGCVTAVNFDGGGSSAMAVKMPGYEDAKVISSPSDGSQRKCSTYVLLVVDGTSDSDSNGGDAGSNASGSDMNDDGQQTSGLVSNGGDSGDSGSVSNGAGSGISAITLVQAGTVVYQGASLNLSCKAFDRNYATVAAPSDTTMKVAEGYGNINGSVYNAGWVAGMEKIELASESAGVSSMSSVYVTNMLSSVNVTADGKSATSINASRGQQIQFDETAKYYGRDVVIGNNNFAYTLSGDDIAEISNTGLLTIKNDTNGGSATLTIAAGAVVKTVKITVASVFDDISGHWAEQYILDLYKSGIVGGVSAGRFSPQSEIKRADFMLMLYRAEGCPKVALTGTSDGIQNFADVADGAYYADAVMWAKGLGIAKGSGDMFRPLDSMTREEAFTFLYRYMNMKSSEDSTDDGTAMDGSVDDGGAASTGGGTVTSDATDDGTLKAGLADGEAVLADELSDNGANDEAVLADGSDEGVSAGVTNADVLTGLFKDASEISSYAAESVTALVNAGIVTGSNGMLRPKAKLTRAEMCKILYMTLNK